MTPNLVFQIQRGGYNQRGRSRFGSRGRGGFSNRMKGFTQQVNTYGWNHPQDKAITTIIVPYVRFVVVLDILLLSAGFIMIMHTRMMTFLKLLLHFIFLIAMGTSGFHILAPLLIPRLQLPL
ncbi:unnamed protein product [Cochlearia groenlandica]